MLLLLLLWQVAFVMICHTDDDVVTDTEINVGRIGRIQCLTARVELMVGMVMITPGCSPGRRT